ncbi:MAG: hypothetical protein J1D85_00215 [Bacteroidales bacterium]|nr:hypothetical protein [Bacteroidales bacterium]
MSLIINDLTNRGRYETPICRVYSMTPAAVICGSLEQLLPEGFSGFEDVDDWDD